MVVRRSSPVSIPTSAKKVVVSVSDLMGGAIGGLDVVADSLTKKGDSAPVLQKVCRVWPVTILAIDKEENPADWKHVVVFLMSYVLSRMSICGRIFDRCIDIKE